MNLYPDWYIQLALLAFAVIAGEKQWVRKLLRQMLRRKPRNVPPTP